MKVGLTALGLEKCDRLEPTAAMPNVALLDNLCTFPFAVLFWRRFPDAVCYRRNPLMEPRIGLGLEQFATDVMHCFFLGFVQSYIGEVFWSTVNANGFNL